MQFRLMCSVIDTPVLCIGMHCKNIRPTAMPLCRIIILYCSKGCKTSCEVLVRWICQSQTILVYHCSAGGLWHQAQGVE